MKVIIMIIFTQLLFGLLSGQPEQGNRKSQRSSRLLISEIMADPDPPVGLPEFEYAEWYNSGADTIYLAGWQWVAGDKHRRLSNGIIIPGGYVIVCAASAAAAFRLFGEVIVVESFPALRNSGDRLALVNPAGIAVHTVEYSPDQFADALKAGGGWSLELADPAHYCSPEAWSPSVDPTGGTPGRANSRILDAPIAGPAALLRAAGQDDGHFVLIFSGTLDPMQDPNNYACRLMPGVIHAVPAPAPGYGFPGLSFSFPGELDRDLIYTVEIDGPIMDCEGRPAMVRPVSLGFPSPPDSAGVVITEIMFDPLSGQPEFVEVFNRSGRVVELKELIIARAGTTGLITGFSDQQAVSYWLFPGSYAVFTGDDKLFSRSWPSADPGTIAERPDMPALTNEESQLILLDRNQKRLDAAVYSPAWHYPYLEGQKGVSLERISADASGLDRGNWFSAPAASGGSTPGRENSSVILPPTGASGIFTLMPTAGYASNSTDPVRLSVRYRFDESGWFLQVRIFSCEGLPVRELFPFAMANPAGMITWDGLDGDRQQVADGIFLVVAEYYHPSGKKGRWKRACAVVRGY